MWMSHRHDLGSFPHFSWSSQLPTSSCFHHGGASSPHTVMDFSIDVLTDGSEGTGAGTLFLSVQKKDRLLARYGLTGLGDATSRLAADQRYKLGVVRAVLNTHHQLWGLPGLLLALKLAPDVTIVSSEVESIQAISELSSPQRYPQVKLCRVPDDVSQWWLVYQDDYLIVHGQSTGDGFWMAVCTLPESSKRFLVLPPNATWSNNDRNLPVVDGSCRPIDFTIGLHGDVKWAASDHDPNLLVRARHQSQHYHSCAPSFYPWRLEKAQQSRQGLVTGTSLYLATMEIVDRCEEISLGEVPDPPLPFVSDENEIDIDDDEPAEYPQLLVLGTGCASPSPYRGSSGYALHTSTEFSIILEVGEAFVTQWNRYAEGRDVSTIRVIWISHAHWDHYGGLVPLLESIRLQREAKRLKRAPLWLVAPPKVLRYVKIMLGEAPGVRVCLMKDSSTMKELLQDVPEIRAWDHVRVDHSCYDAYGTVLECQQDSFVLCFSGDTRPSRALVDACRGRNVDLLIHEATFNDTEIEMSVAKKHSTIEEALRVARDMGAKQTLLTHFSHRYDKMQSNVASNGRVAFAVDGMLFRCGTDR